MYHLKMSTPMLKIKSFVISALFTTIRENMIEDTKKELSLFINVIVLNTIRSEYLNYCNKLYLSASDQATMNMPS